MSKADRREKNRAAEAGAARPSRFREYFWANLVFWVFILVLSLAVWISCQDPHDELPVRAVLAETFTFMIMLFGCGFTLVTLFDAGYDFFTARSGEAGKKEGQEGQP